MLRLFEGEEGRDSDVENNRRQAECHLSLLRDGRGAKEEGDSQLLRCGTSIGANVREGQYAQSKKDFISKMNRRTSERRAMLA